MPINPTWEETTEENIPSWDDTVEPVQFNSPNSSISGFLPGFRDVGPGVTPEQEAMIPINLAVAEQEKQSGLLGDVMGEVGLPFRAAAADIGAFMRGSEPEFSGNLLAGITGGQLPIDKALDEAALEEAQLGPDEFGRPRGAAVLGRIGQGLAGSAPLLAVGGLPSAAQRLIAAGFGAQMGHDLAYRIAPELGTELGKPESERDPVKLSNLYSEAIQSGAFTPLAGAFAGRPGTPKPVEKFQTRNIAEDLNRMAQRASDVRAVEAGSPFLRAQAVGKPIPGPQTVITSPEIPAGKGLSALRSELGKPTTPTPDAPTYGPVSYQLGEPVPQFLDPSGLNMARGGAQPQPTAPLPPSMGGRAVSFFDRPGEIGGFGESLAPTIEQIRAQRALEERKANATRTRQEGRQPQREQTETRGLPPEAERGNRSAQGGAGPEAQTPQKVAADFGIRFDNEYQNFWNFTAFDSAGKPSTSFVTKKGATPAEIAAKYNKVRDSYEGAPNAPRELQAAKPEPPQPDWQVSVQSASGEIPGNVQIVDPRATETSVSPTVQSLRGAGFHVPDFSKLPQGKYTYGEAVQKATQLEAHGGGESTLTHEQRATSRKNNSREAFQKLQAEADAAKARAAQPEPVAPEPAVESVTALDPQSGAPLSATDALINKLEAAGQSLTEWADQTITRSKSLGVQPVGGPELLAAYTIKGAQLIGKGVAKFDEWSREMIKQYGPKIKDQLNTIWASSQAMREREASFSKPSGTDVGVPERAGGQAKQVAGTGSAQLPETVRLAGSTGSAQGASVKMRKLSDRGTRAPSIPEPVQEQIAEAPESRYRQQSVPKVQQQVRAMSDQELSAVGKESDIYTAARLEQANRLFDNGNNAGGYRVFQDLSQELTRLGQVVNQAKLLTALQPENVVRVVNESLKAAKRDPLTAPQAEKLQGLSKVRIDAERVTDLATDEWLKNPTEANAVKAEQALMDANRAAISEQRMVHNFQDRSMSSLLKSILQGNLLTPISQVANVFGNVSFLPFRSATRTIATGIDMLDSFIRNRPREVSVAPVSGTAEAAKGLVRGLKQVPDIFLRGTGDVIKGESRASLHPLRAWVKQFAKEPEGASVGGKIPLSERVKLAVEGTLGLPAEPMLRGLGAGDIGFREAARARLIAEQSRLQKVPQDQRAMAQKFPELFFDKETLARIESETRGAIFQRESKALGHLMSWLKGKGDKFDLLAATIAPYKLTPWNIVGEILSYNPLIAMGRTALEAKRGNIRNAEMNAGKVVIGSMLTYAGYWLYNKGLLAPSMDSGDEVQKARVLAGQVLPPNHVNLSGLKRALTGGDPTFQPGDKTIDIFRAGGLAGSMLYMAANTGRDIELKPEADSAILSILKNSTIEQARFGLNQSFLKGVTGLLDAVKEGDTDTFLQSYASTVLSVPLPNTLSALSRANREYKVDTKGQNLGDQIANVVKTRLGFAGADDYLPLKRGLWGEPIPETPKDRNALVYHFFDISKGQQVTDDPVPLELYRLWRKTANTGIIPSPPEKTFTFAKNTYLLNPAQQSRLAELVGEQRRQVVDRIVINPNWHKIPDEAKIRILKRIYDRGLDVGKARFWQESGGQLEEKKGRAGFAPAQ